MPRPPTWIRQRIIVFPRVVNAVEVSTTIRPVTHTALAEVKKESRKDNGRVCARGSINIPEPISMITRKLVAKSNAGGIFIELITFARVDISESPIRKAARMT